MEAHTRSESRRAPREEAVRLADAVKRILLFDDGQLAERLDSIIALPMMEGPRESAMFFALTGKEPGEMMELLGIDPERIGRRPLNGLGRKE